LVIDGANGRKQRRLFDVHRLQEAVAALHAGTDSERAGDREILNLTGIDHTGFGVGHAETLGELLQVGTLRHLALIATRDRAAVEVGPHRPVDFGDRFVELLPGRRQG